MYYKVNLRKNVFYDKNTSLLERNYSNNNVVDKIIVKKKFLSATEIFSDIDFSLLNRKKASYVNGYYVLKDDIKDENIATAREVKKYIEEYSEKKHKFYDECLSKIKKIQDQKSIKEYLKRK